MYHIDACFRAISDTLPIGILMSDMQGNCIYSNAAYHALSGQTLAESLDTYWINAIHPEDRQRLMSIWSETLTSGKSLSAEIRYLRRDDVVIWIQFSSTLIHYVHEHELVKAYVIVVEDISANKAIKLLLQTAEETLFEQQERAQVTLNSIGDAVLATNAAGNISYLNRVAETMTGWSMEESIGQPLAKIFNVIDGETRQILGQAIRDKIKENKIAKLSRNCLLIRRDGYETPIENSIAPIHTRDNEISGAVIVFHDVGDSRILAQKMLNMAQHDPLTGLANRLLLTERLMRALGLAQRKNRKVGLLYIDLDNFKNINDSFGHSVGDELLQSVAKRLQEIVRSTDTVCRQGGDEFVILLTEIEHYYYAEVVARKMIRAIASPYFIREHELKVTVSIGISVYPVDCKGVETALQHADHAMYQAKSAGRNNYKFYDANPIDIASVSRNSF